MKSKKEMQLTVLRNNTWDVPQSVEDYYTSLDKARNAGINEIKENGGDAFCVRYLTTGRGHFRTVGYFDAEGKFLR